MTLKDLLEAAADPDAWERKQMEKPLHVRVAEALGWTECVSAGIDIGEGPLWLGLDPETPQAIRRTEPPRYDTDWSATGPLIERHRIMVQPEGSSALWMASMDRDAWGCPFGAEGKTPLESVCNLILALHEAGKLPSLSSASPSP